MSCSNCDVQVEAFNLDTEEWRTVLPGLPFAIDYAGTAPKVISH